MSQHLLQQVILITHLTNILCLLLHFTQSIFKILSDEYYLVWNSSGHSGGCLLLRCVRCIDSGDVAISR